VAAARADGGVNRSTKVFANIKTVIRTCQKQGVNVFDYARQVLRAPRRAPRHGGCVTDITRASLKHTANPRPQSARRG
jgi:hypothetical protein